KTDFRYQEGDRRARGDRATLEQQKDLMTLDGSARVWDPTGSASADKIVMNQKSGDFVADGHVASVREPDKKGKSSSSVLSNGEGRADFHDRYRVGHALSRRGAHCGLHRRDGFEASGDDDHVETDPRLSEGFRFRFVARQSIRGWNGKDREYVREAEADASGNF